VEEVVAMTIERENLLFFRVNKCTSKATAELVELELSKK